jgi:hypothetical protein
MYPAEKGSFNMYSTSYYVLDKVKWLLLFFLQLSCDDNGYYVGAPLA